MNPIVFAPWLSLCAILAIVAPASARSLDLPVRDSRSPASASSVPARAYAGDVLELRLAPQAARIARTVAGATRASRLGIASVDALANEIPGVWFEPMFPNEAHASGGSDLGAFYV